MEKPADSATVAETLCEAGQAVAELIGLRFRIGGAFPVFATGLLLALPIQTQ